MENRGINTMRNCPAKYKGFPPISFENDNDATRYNKRMKYDYEKESSRILRGMRSGK